MRLSDFFCEKTGLGFSEIKGRWTCLYVAGGSGIARSEPYSTDEEDFFLSLDT